MFDADHDIEIEQSDLVITPIQDAFTVFTAPLDNPDTHPIAATLKRVRDAIDSFEGDISTATGRRRIASMARRVASAKAALEGVGKDLADEQKQIPKRIDATRAHIRKTLDAWRDEVRQPLTDWETAEEQRRSAHEHAIARLITMSTPHAGADAEALRLALREANAVEIGPACEEYEGEYTTAKATAIQSITAALVAREVYEAEQAELAKLRAEADLRAKQDHEANLRRDAEQRALQAAAAEIERAKAAQADAERRAAEAEQAVAAARVKDKPTTDASHRAQVNRAAVAALLGIGLDESLAKSVVRAIYAGRIPNITISY